MEFPLIQPMKIHKLKIQPLNNSTDENSYDE
nr:MAG TPA: hypothetical protein [Caudoviricetes sp.]